MTENRNSIGLKPKDIATAYLLLRLLIGVNFFNHGFTRTGNIPGFVEQTVNGLQGSYFPEPLVRSNAFLVPIIELIVGILMTLGLATRTALIVTFALMVMLMLGVTSVQNWDAAGNMLVYGIVLFILLACSSFNIFSIDYWMHHRRKLGESSELSDQSFVSFINKFWVRSRRRKESISLWQKLSR